MSHIQLGGHRGQYFQRVDVECNDESFKAELDFRVKYHNKDIYRTTYTYLDSNKDTCRLAGDFYIDLDSDSPEESRQDTIIVVNRMKQIFGIPEDRIGIYFSGKKGFHIIVAAEVIGADPCVHLNLRYKRLASILCSGIKTFDQSVYDRKRVFRLENSINGKSGLYKVRLSFEELSSMSMEHIYGLAKLPRPVRDLNRTPAGISFYRMLFPFVFTDADLMGSGEIKKPDRYICKMQPCIKKAMEGPVTEGKRNSTAAALVNACLQLEEDTMEQMTEGMKKWNREKVSPALSETELLSCISSSIQAFNRGKRYGCNKFTELGYCQGPKCSLWHTRRYDGEVSYVQWRREHGEHV